MKEVTSEIILQPRRTLTFVTPFIAICDKTEYCLDNNLNGFVSVFLLDL